MKNKKRGITASSRRWVERHDSDLYVRLAKQDGYRSRAAYKLLDIQKSFSVINVDNVVLDLGSSPGSWSQVAINIAKRGVVVAVDILPMKKLSGVYFYQNDCLSKAFGIKVQELLFDVTGQKNGCVDVILSDMSPNSSGFGDIDHVRSLLLCEACMKVAHDRLRKNGNLVMKCLQGAEQDNFISHIRTFFSKVTLFKPKASRKESREIYIVAQGKL
ncbi:RlmE family RNA methyltransferase [Candidatus Sneabacter namystus]|uniref:Ribosomal RNA large subunit methyltransferase E n=1 Tax=Candidatus Sneabacter namystus TaxID=2601646 RepID=A0A5C0UJA5_9RICK|nr:RlmE family RNA methyltransferase [Candidatus Sneabacter namystus]QEK39840.1 RlmE family RNA methyltransferase [Candidatus Sneabacter namystus]